MSPSSMLQEPHHQRSYWAQIIIRLLKSCPGGSADQDRPAVMRCIRVYSTRAGLVASPDSITWIQVDNWEVVVIGAVAVQVARTGGANCMRARAAQIGGVRSAKYIKILSAKLVKNRSAIIDEFRTT